MPLISLLSHLSLRNNSRLFHLLFYFSACLVAACSLSVLHPLCYEVDLKKLFCSLTIFICCICGDWLIQSNMIQLIVCNKKLYHWGQYWSDKIMSCHSQQMYYNMSSYTLHSLILLIVYILNHSMLQNKTCTSHIILKSSPTNPAM